MYYQVGLPKRVKIPGSDNDPVQAVVCNRDRILFAVLTAKACWIWFSRPCVPIVVHRRSEESINSLGTNKLLEWRPDSSMIVVATNKNHLIFYSIVVDESRREVYEQKDSPNPSLKRESAELYTCESIPPLVFSMAFETEVSGGVTGLVCLRDELMVATRTGHIQRLRWDTSLNYDYCIDLRRIPFCDDQLVMKAIPLDAASGGVHVIDLEYSPLVGGFAIVLSDGRAAFLTASTLKFDPNAVQGIWARELDDATCAAINHKYRLLAYGRESGCGIVYTVDEATGGLQTSHRMELSSRDYAGNPGPVGYMKWSPDGTVLGMCWQGGGMSLWSVFGSLLTVSLRWDYTEDPRSRAIAITTMEWAAEGYDVWCVQQHQTFKSEDSQSDDCVTDTERPAAETNIQTSVLQFSFIKSALTVNPCMSRVGRVLLQGNDRLYINTSEGLNGASNNLSNDSHDLYFDNDDDDGELDEVSNPNDPANISANKQWIVIPIPYSYTASNWPIRYTCIEEEGELVGVAGRNGVAHYSLKNRRWYLFGNESQERDFVVTGGLLWWRRTWLILGSYNIPANADELRIYPRDQKLDNQFVTTVPQPSQVLLLNIYGDQLIVLTADCHITVYNLHLPDSSTGGLVTVTRVQEVDISGLTVHPACVVSILLTSLRTESWHGNPNGHTLLPAQSVIINISGKVLMIQRDQHADTENPNGKLFQCAQMTPIVLAGSCEVLWCSSVALSHKPHLSHALWLHCGYHGTRAWLPLFPNSQDKSHTFMARRIMLPFNPSIYPLAVLFEEGLMLGAETDTSLLVCDSASLHQPLTVVERTSQVYLHHLLRQLLRRNLGYHAWEVASTCRDLPYFPHALELLLHQVLEEEATSKDPLPDCLLPRVVEFIREFPVYLKTVVQCARKTELALWRYLFSAAGSPKMLFSQALEQGQLDTAASYLIILQNLESATISRSHATRLLDATLESGKWDLSKDLIRFLRSIDPSDLDSPKPSAPSSGSTRVGFCHATPPVSPACADEDLSMILPNTQVLRGRSYSAASAKVVGGDGFAASVSTGGHPSVVRTTSGSDSTKIMSDNRKRSVSREVSSAEEFFLDVILQRHAKKLLTGRHLKDLGTMAAHLDFPLVSWLRKERNRAARVDDFVSTLKSIHNEFTWPYPSVHISQIRRYSAGSLRSLTSFDDKSLVEDCMGGLAISVPKGECDMSGGEIGDSGYLSQATGETRETTLATTPQHGPHSPTIPNAMNDLMPLQAQLLPHSPRPGDTMSVMSEEASVYGDESVSASDWSPVGGDPMRDLLQRPQDPPPQAPPHAEVQLRYLLQVLLEAGCLEWCVVIATVLRDALAVLRAVNLARSPDVPIQVISRLSQGLRDTHHFTNTECLGYQSFLSAIMGQVGVLERLLSAREASQASSPEASPNTSRDKGSASPSQQRRGSKHSPGPPQPTGIEATVAQSDVVVVDSESELHIESVINVGHQQHWGHQETLNHHDKVKTTLVLPSPPRVPGPPEDHLKDHDFKQEEEKVSNIEDDLMPTKEEGSAACIIS